MKKIFFTILFCFSFLSSQENFLIKIGENSISVSEFLNIYNKNRPESDTLINSSEIQEYLDLFINFKLKVIEAESLGLDTLSSFKKELNGYRNQLAKSYLTDTKVTDDLLKEAYERLKIEINASHILIKINPDSDPLDTLKALERIKKVKKEYYSGKDFSDLAIKYSEDPSVDKNKGNLGYFSALRMVYPFETAAYTTDVGEVSDPIRTSYGYHILKVNDKRNSRGDVKVAHIMIGVQKNNSDSLAKKKIFEIHDLVNSGSDFFELAKKYSDDKKSGSNGGELDWFGVTNKVNMYESFADVSFGLSSIGDISKPVQTPAGWHIIKLLDRKKLPSFKEMQMTLKSKVEKDSRSQKSRNALIKKCKDYYSFKENKRYLNIFYNMSSEDFLASKTPSDLFPTKGKKLFNLTFQNNEEVFFQKDFAFFLINFKNSFRKQKNSKLIINELYRMFVEQSIINFEKQNLEKRYNEFALLMDEYHDGILLFELMNEKVWSQAVKDTSGLKNFYLQIIENDKSEKYFYPHRVLKKIYETYNEKTQKKVYRQVMRGMNDEYLMNRFNKESSLNLKIYEEILPINDSLVVNSLSHSENVFFVNVILDSLNKSVKPIEEVKGLVISEYQNFLEKKWIHVLKEKYEIIINEDVLGLLKENRLSELQENILNEVIEDNNSEIPIFHGSFSDAYKKAVKKLGSGKNVYFQWKDNIYTTE